MKTEEFTIQMDDGVRLFGWVQYEEPLEPKPVALCVSIYGIPAIDLPLPFRQFLDPEFSFAYVHLRGIGSSEGLFDMFGRRTKDDAWAVLDGVANQPWCDGRIVSLGGSGFGVFNFANAATGHPALKAVNAATTVFDQYRDACWPGGATTGRIMNEIGPVLEASLRLPMNVDARGRVGISTDIIDAQAEAVHRTFERMRNEPLFSDWWRERSFWDEAPKAPSVPMFIWSSFHDLTSWNGHPHAYHRYPNAWLFMGGGHDGPERLMQAFGNDLRRRFFRHFVLGEDNGFDAQKRVVLPVGIGSRMAYAYSEVLLRQDDDWPLPDTRWTRLYLRPGASGSASSLNDGVLGLDEPDGDASDDLPIATKPPVRINVRLEHWAIAKWSTGAGAAVTPPSPRVAEILTPPPEVKDVPLGDLEGARGPGDALGDLRIDEETQLTYTTEPFTTNVELTGPVTMRLFASSTAADLVWLVRLTDVWPDGTSMWLTDQLLRASLRRVDPNASDHNAEGEIICPYQTFDTPEPLEPGSVAEFLIDAGAIANVFRAGHRLRLDIGAVVSVTEEVASTPGTITVHYSPEYPSSILLPLVPAEVGSTPMAFEEHEHPGESAASMAEALGEPVTAQSAGA